MMLNLFLMLAAQAAAPEAAPPPPAGTAEEQAFMVAGQRFTACLDDGVNGAIDDTGVPVEKAVDALIKLCQPLADDMMKLQLDWLNTQSAMSAKDRAKTRKEFVASFTNLRKTLIAGIKQSRRMDRDGD